MPHYCCNHYIRSLGVLEFSSILVFTWFKMLKNWPSWCVLIFTTFATIEAVDDDYNILHRDGSFQFGYNNPDSYHHAAGNRNNVVRGEFGGRNPGTGRIDSVEYTAGPRGFRPRGKNVHRKYDLNQNGPRPVGSRDDPYYDPFEDPSYNFEFKTRTYNRQESANRVGDVTGRYNYIDDVGELHNVEFVAGKNTGFHVKTPFPDSNPRAYYGRLYYRGRGKPIPRGRTSIQRGLDGSYRFVSAGPDQRRTETSDSSGHVRGSYTYLDDKGVQHSVHYIAGPETGYRVLKNVKGPHLPTVYPFGRPEIIPSDFYDKDDVFDTAASGHVKPSGGGTKPDDLDSDGSNFGGRPDGDNISDGGGEGIDFDKPLGGSGSRPGGEASKPGGGSSRPGSGGSRPGIGGNRPGSGGIFNRPPPTIPTGDDFGSDGDESGDDFEGELFGPSGGGSGSRPRPKPTQPSRPGGSSGGSRPGGGFGGQKPGGSSGGPRPGGNSEEQKPGGSEGSRPGGGSGGQKPGGAFGGQKPGVDDGSYKPDFGDTGDDGSYIPPGDANQDDGSYKPGFDETGLGGESPRPGGFGVRPTRPPPRPIDTSFTDDYDDANGLFGSESNPRPPRPPVIQVQPAGAPNCERCAGTIVTNVGDKLFSVPPGVSVRAHVQSIDLLPLVSKVPSPSEQYNEDMSIKTEQLNSAASDIVSNNSTATESGKTAITTTIPTTTIADTEATTVNE